MNQEAQVKRAIRIEIKLRFVHLKIAVPLTP